MRRIASLLLVLICVALMGSMPLLNIPYQITSVDALTNGLFRLQGYVYDASQLGYGAPDVATNDCVIIQGGITGDIDLYRISNIWSQADSWLVVDVAYAEDGAPRSGQPEAGYQEISRDGYLYSTTFGGPSEYLQNGARNLFYRLLATRVTALEPGGTNNAIFFLDNGSTSSAYHVTAGGVTNFLGDFFP